MGHKVTCVLLMVLMLALNALAEDDEGKCKVAGPERVDCGYPGITAEECKKRDCCFVSYPPGYPWCFPPANRNKTRGSDQENESEEEECLF